MTTEKKPLPVLKILEEGGIIKITRPAADTYRAALLGQFARAEIAADIAATPLKALNRLLAQELHVTRVTLGEKEVRLCWAVLAFAEEHYTGTNRDEFNREALKVWLRLRPDTGLLPAELLEYLATATATLHAYARRGGTVLEANRAMPFRLNTQVKDATCELVVRLAGGLGYDRAAAEGQLGQAEARMVEDLTADDPAVDVPQQIFVSAGAL